MRNDLDRMFIGELRTNTNPIRFSMGGDQDGHVIPAPDRQLMYELSLVVRSYYFRRDKKLNAKTK